MIIKFLRSIAGWMLWSVPLGILAPYVMAFYLGSRPVRKIAKKPNKNQRITKMGAYICEVCDGMFCSHEVNFYHCDKCDTSFCEDCWQERLHEDQDWGECDICGDCYVDLLIKAAELTEPENK